MKRNAIFRIIAWTISLVILVGILIAGMSWRYDRTGFLSGFSLVEATETPDSVVSADSSDVYVLKPHEINEIKIDWLAGSIRICPSSDALGIEIQESGVSDSRYKLVCHQDGNTIKINYCESSFRNMLNVSPLKKDLTILVPENFSLKDLDVDAASAKLSVQDLTIQEVSIDTASGESRFEHCTVDTLDIDTASGDVYFDGSLNKLDCDSASAGVQAVLDNVPYEIDIDTASGSLELFLPEDAGFSAKMDTMSGKFDSTLSYTAKNGRYIRGNGACDIDVSSMSGNVTIRSK